jgi:hypothetical protein
MIALLFALLAALTNGTPMGDTIENCTPIVRPFEFIGCEDQRPLPEDDAPYAGLLWHDGTVSLETGP